MAYDEVLRRSRLPAGHGLGRAVESVLGEDAGRFAGGDVGEPTLHVGEGAAVAGGGEDEAGEEVLGCEGPEVFAAAVVADLRDEVVG